MPFAFFSVTFVLLFFFFRLWQLSLRLVYLGALESLNLKLLELVWSVVVEILQYLRRTIQRITAIKQYAFMWFSVSFLGDKDFSNS